MLPLIKLHSKKQNIHVSIDVNGNYVLILHCFYLTVIYLSYLPENTRTKYISKKQTTQNTAKQHYPGSVASYDARPGNKVGLFYNAPEHTRGTRYQIR